MFIVEDLLSIPVNSYKEIEQKMDEGTKQRTIAATDMNATSSRWFRSCMNYAHVNSTTARSVE